MCVFNLITSTYCSCHDSERSEDEHTHTHNDDELEQNSDKTDKIVLKLIVLCAIQLIPF